MNSFFDDPEFQRILDEIRHFNPDPRAYLKWKGEKVAHFEGAESLRSRYLKLTEEDAAVRFKQDQEEHKRTAKEWQDRNDCEEKRKKKVLDYLETARASKLDYVELSGEIRRFAEELVLRLLSKEPSDWEPSEIKIYKLFITYPGRQFYIQARAAFLATQCVGPVLSENSVLNNSARSAAALLGILAFQGQAELREMREMKESVSNIGDAVGDIANEFNG